MSPRMPPAAPPRAPTDEKNVETFDTPERKIGFEVARIAHWMVNERRYTKAQVARDLAAIAKKLLPPELYEPSIGDAGKL